MAVTVAAGGISIGVVSKLHPQQPTSQFLGRKLGITKPSASAQTSSNSKIFVVFASGGELIHAVHDLFLGVGVGLPCTVMECGDMIYRSTLPKSNALTITVPGAILALGALSYLWATPGVAPGFFDMFVLAFVERFFRSTYKKDDFVLGKKLGEGAFGVVYKVSLANKKAKKEEALVLKKATEYGAVEIWMNERVRTAVLILSTASLSRRVLRRKKLNIGLYGILKGKPRYMI